MNAILRYPMIASTTIAIASSATTTAATSNDATDDRSRPAPRIIDSA